MRGPGGGEKWPLAKQYARRIGFFSFSIDPVAPSLEPVKVLDGGTRTQPVNT